MSQRLFSASRVAIRSQPLRQQVARRQYSSTGGSSGFSGTQDNAFNRERQAVRDHAAASSDLWRKLSLYVAIPFLIISGVNAKRLWDEHWEHKAHEEPPDHPEYQYQNIRTKNFCWGDGDKTLFWNDNVNRHEKE